MIHWIAPRRSRGVGALPFLGHEGKETASPAVKSLYPSLLVAPRRGDRAVTVINLH